MQPSMRSRCPTAPATDMLSEYGSNVVKMSSSERKHVVIVGLGEFDSCLQRQQAHVDLEEAPLHPAPGLASPTRTTR